MTVNPSNAKLRERSTSGTVGGELNLGVLVGTDSNIPEFQKKLDGAGRLRWEFPPCEERVRHEPPGWDAMLVDASFGLTPRQASERFGISGPVLAIIHCSNDLSLRWHELEHADGLVRANVEPVELLAHVRLAVRAWHRQEIIRAGVVQVDLLRRLMHGRYSSIPLTAGETLILGALARTAGRWWSSTELLALNGTSHQSSVPVWVCLHRLRTKLGAERGIIESRRGAGYRLNPCALLEGPSRLPSAGEASDIRRLP